MAEGRMLTKRVSRSDKISSLSSDTARMLYTWLIPYLDVEGRMEANPRLLKGDIAPLLDHITPKIIEKILQELHQVGLIMLYAGPDGKPYLQVTRFEENQKNLRKDREARSIIPGPTPDQLRSNSGPDPDLLPPNIREEKLREENINNPKGTPEEDGSPVDNSAAGVPFKIPTKEEIQESSVPKIEKDIEEVCLRLYEEKIFPDVYAFKNKMAKSKKNGRGILHVLSRCYLTRPEDPWAYCQKIIAVEDQNYNERDYQKNT